MRERQRERDGNGEARRAGDRVVVGPTKLPGSTTDTFLNSNHQDTMTTRSLASSPARRSSSAIGPIIAFLFIIAARKSLLDEYHFIYILKLLRNDSVSRLFAHNDAYDEIILLLE